MRLTWLNKRLLTYLLNLHHVSVCRAPYIDSLETYIQTQWFEMAWWNFESFEVPYILYWNYINTLLLFAGVRTKWCIIMEITVQCSFKSRICLVVHRWLFNNFRWKKFILVRFLWTSLMKSWIRIVFHWLTLKCRRKTFIFVLILWCNLIQIQIKIVLRCTFTRLAIIWVHLLRYNHIIIILFPRTRVVMMLCSVDWITVVFVLTTDNRYDDDNDDEDEERSSDPNHQTDYEVVGFRHLKNKIGKQFNWL